VYPNDDWESRETAMQSLRIQQLEATEDKHIRLFFLDNGSNLAYLEPKEDFRLDTTPQCHPENPSSKVHYHALKALEHRLGCEPHHACTRFHGLSLAVFNQ